MCMRLGGTQRWKFESEYSFTLPDAEPQQGVIGYKVIRKNGKSPFCAGKGYKWEEGWNQSSRTSTTLTALEKEYVEANEGFHVMADLEQARILAAELEAYNSKWAVPEYQRGSKCVVIKVFVAHEDVVSYGSFYQQPVLVCTKCFNYGEV
jgi:hypothetical protein